MAEYLLIESRDPFESNNVGYYYNLALGLVDGGNKVTLFLTQNAVFAARPLAQGTATWSSKPYCSRKRRHSGRDSVARTAMPASWSARASSG